MIESGIFHDSLLQYKCIGNVQSAKAKIEMWLNKACPPTKMVPKAPPLPSDLSYSLVKKQETNQQKIKEFRKIFQSKIPEDEGLIKCILKLTKPSDAQ